MRGLLATVDEQAGKIVSKRSGGAGTGTERNPTITAPASLGYADLVLIDPVSVSHRWFAKMALSGFQAANPTYDKERHENSSVTENQKYLLEYFFAAVTAGAAEKMEGTKGNADR